ncbi:hypothetical protein LZ023_11595 [Pseudomonas silvicola]|nr:hypothetical protein LZ023_11595 [Pseudomonas silvicola]
MMKRLCLPLGLGLAFAALGSQAAEPCHLQLDHAQLDYGQLQLPAGTTLDRFSQAHSLATRKVRVQVSCPQPSPLAIDLLGASEGGLARFADAGQLNLRLLEAMVDGRAVDLANVDQGGTGLRELDVRPGQRIVPVSAGQALAGSEWTMSLQVTPALPLGELRRADETLLQGSLTLQLAE